MSKYQQEWKQILQQQQTFKDWRIRTSGGDLLIRVPESTDMQYLENDFPDIIADLATGITVAKSTIKFYVGNSSQASFVFIL